MKAWLNMEAFSQFPQDINILESPDISYKHTEKSLNISLEHKHTTGDKIKMKAKQETRKTRNKVRLHKI